MNHGARRAIEVWADWVELRVARRMGTLSATPERRKEVFAFEYDSDWLKGGFAQALDPGLVHFGGPQYPPTPKDTFGLFLDSAPDRWGRMLMDRREARRARDHSRPKQTLRESDYLLGVLDLQRMGALRFRLDPQGPFLDDDPQFATPPWTSLRTLEHASLKIEVPAAEQDPRYSQWLRMLVAPGGSLGGARPKAGVVDPCGHLWIAKFPSRGDTFDNGAWELVLHQLARQAGIALSPAKASKFNTARHTFLTKRFDRTDQNRRVHFASAMTLLGRRDGDDHSNGASYLELAEFLMKEGAQPNEDLEELWRRIVFFVCVSNVDDHLRNHGFLLRDEGWQMSPAYDMNPDPYADGLKLNISEVDNAQDLELVLEVAPYFRVQPERSRNIVADVVSAVRTWRETARAIGISAAEIDQMEAAFRIAEGATP